MTNTNTGYPPILSCSIYLFIYLFVYLFRDIIQHKGLELAMEIRLALNSEICLPASQVLGFKERTPILSYQLIFWKQCLSLSKACRLARKLQGSACLCSPPSARVQPTPHTGFFPWVLGILALNVCTGALYQLRHVLSSQQPPFHKEIIRQ